MKNQNSRSFFNSFFVFILGLVSGGILAYFLFSWVSRPSYSVEELENQGGEINIWPEISQESLETATPILMYHHIEEGSNSLYLSPANFQEQMAFLYAKGQQAVSLDELFTPSSKNFIITFDDGYKDVIQNAYPILEELDFKATVFLIYDYIGKVGYLTWEDVRFLENEGWQFGSHTLAHRNLTSLSNEGAEKEITQSKSKLEQKLKNPVNFFCYPIGKFNQDIKDLVKEAGYKGAVTTLSGKDNKTEDIYQLKRIRISGFDTLESFIKKLK